MMAELPGPIELPDDEGVEPELPAYTDEGPLSEEEIAQLVHDALHDRPPYRMGAAARPEFAAVMKAPDPAAAMAQALRDLGPRPPRDELGARLQWFRKSANIRGVELTNWLEAKRVYVEGIPDAESGLRFVSMAEIGQTFDVSEAAVKKRASREGWVAERAAFVAKIEDRRQRRRANRLAIESEKLDTSVLDAAKAGVTLVKMRMHEVAERSKDSLRSDARQTRIDARELSVLATALDVFHRVALRALGDPDAMKTHEVTNWRGNPQHISEALKRDDPERLAAVIAILGEVGLDDALPGLGSSAGEEPGRRPALGAGG